MRATCSEARYRSGEQAVQDATTACELTSWKNDSYIDTLSTALAEAGRFGEAIKRLEQAIKMGPDNYKAERGKMMTAYKAGKPHRDESKE